MKTLVSVIVPIYKVENCLIRCLDSLYRQSFSDIEILLINDASPDRCGEICDNYAKMDMRFRVFHNKVNRGLSVARNIGIANASGDWLMFVDGDDYVHEDFCKEAYECAVHCHADLVLFKFKYLDKPDCFSMVNNKNVVLGQSSYKTRLETIDLLYKDVGQCACNKLYKKELFQGVFFPQGYLYEDIGTIYKTVWRASCIYYLDKVLYYYCYRSGSITSSKSTKALNDRFILFMQQYYDLKAWGYPTEKLDTLLKNIAIDYCIKNKSNVVNERSVFCENILLNSKSIPAEFSLERKVLFVLFKYGRPLFELICKLFGKKFN